MNHKQNKLFRARKELGLTQQEVANFVGIDRTWYVKIEKSGQMPSLGIAMKIAKVLGETVEDIFLPDGVTKCHENDK